MEETALTFRSGFVCKFSLSVSDTIKVRSVDGNEAGVKRTNTSSFANIDSEIRLGPTDEI
jgi:hypothetical protein